MPTAQRPILRPAANASALFQQEKFADATLTLSTRGDSSDGNSKAVRSQIPVHQSVLCTSSEYFDAQATNWQSQSQQQGSRTQLSMTVEPGHMEAAVAFIKAMYDHESLRNASQEQLVHILLLAEQFGAPVIVSNTVQLLKAAGSSLGAAAATQLVQHPSWPDSFMPLVAAVLQSMGQLLTQEEPAGLAASYQQWLTMLCEQGQRLQQPDSLEAPLVAVLGSLNAVWQNEQLKAALLHLPQPAMQVLLGSDRLKVASEDSVFYTVMQYSQQHPGSCNSLLQLVRYPYLSVVCLTAVAGSAAIEHGAAKASQVFRLMHLRNLGTEPVNLGYAVECDHLCDGVWNATVRNAYTFAVNPPPVRVIWQLPFAQLRDLFSSSCRQRIIGPDSPPLFGVGWHVRVLSCGTLFVTCDGPEPVFKAAFKLRVLGEAGRELFLHTFKVDNNFLLDEERLIVSGMFAVEGSGGAADAKVVVPAAGEGSFSIELEVKSSLLQHGWDRDESSEPELDDSDNDFD